ncbi:3194_t:CDS:2 [Paraglomus brasilianum]|uniref:3194_t:CDS:1 n=1 Tax=Paraglomus brasilianum TaxID=144538 RepID=A0A9N8WTP8_9GLOM|nr:3194_t:CDS:2 [Paraglomus brasilianum]
MRLNVAENHDARTGYHPRKERLLIPPAVRYMETVESLVELCELSQKLPLDTEYRYDGEQYPQRSTTDESVDSMDGVERILMDSPKDVPDDAYESASTVSGDCLCETPRSCEETFETFETLPEVMVVVSSASFSSDMNWGFTGFTNGIGNGFGEEELTLSMRDVETQPTRGKCADDPAQVGSWPEKDVVVLINAVQNYGKNWQFIAEYCFGLRKPATAIRRKYRRLTSDNVGLWSPDEDRLINEGARHGRGNWEKLALRLPNRTPADLEDRWHQISTCKQYHWTPEEDHLLKLLVTKLGENWKPIAKQLKKDPRVVKWRYTWSPTHKGLKWSKDELITLVEAYRMYGPDWSRITPLLPSRTIEEVRRHFANNVSLAMRTGKWRVEEVQRFELAFSSYGDRWDEIAKAVKTRTREQCKAYYKNTIERAILRKCKKLNIPANERVVVGVDLSSDGLWRKRDR